MPDKGQYLPFLAPFGNDNTSNSVLITFNVFWLSMSINLKSDPIQKSFIQYLLPALSGMVIKSIFIMGDAWFVGKGVGAEGLGAISLTIPAFSIFTALA